MTAAAALSAWILLMAHTGAAQPLGAAQSSVYRKGSIDWSVIAGGALPVDLLAARSDRRLSLAAIEVGRIMSGRLGSGPLSGQFELLAQVMPIVVRGPEEFWGVGISPVFRWSFAGWKGVRPFAEISAGLMLIDWDTVGDGRVGRNFTEQMGLGVRIGNPSGRALVTGYRFQHISNGSPSLPSPAVDTHQVYIGVSIMR
jgi:Lipid A 3-O-deacylase (PagL)